MRNAIGRLMRAAVSWNSPYFYEEEVNGNVELRRYCSRDAQCVERAGTVHAAQRLSFVYASQLQGPVHVVSQSPN
jgi:hypothetical protein